MLNKKKKSADCFSHLLNCLGVAPEIVNFIFIVSQSKFYFDESWTVV